MTTLFARIRKAAQRRADYNRTVAELSHLPAGLAEDLGIFPGDAEALARRAVYGR